MTPARWAALAALAFALYFAVQGGEYGTTDLLAPPAAGGERAGAGAPAAAGGGLARRATATAIEHDPRVQERVARERFGMIRRGRVAVSAGAGGQHGRRGASVPIAVAGCICLGRR